MQGGMPQACDTLLEGNEGLLIIGFQFSGNRIRAEGTVVRSHRGRIELRAQRNTTLPGGRAGADALSATGDGLPDDGLEGPG
jgi:hypothetical protein